MEENGFVLGLVKPFLTFETPFFSISLFDYVGIDKASLWQEKDIVKMEFYDHKTFRGIGKWEWKILLGIWVIIHISCLVY